MKIRGIRAKPGLFLVFNCFGNLACLASLRGSSFRHTNTKEFPERLPGGTSLAQTTRPTNPRDIFRYPRAPPKPVRTWPIPPAQKSTLTLNTGAIRKAEKAWSACCGQTFYNNSPEDRLFEFFDRAFCDAQPES